jgi:Asp-tRNA(Asn)/Glu-tRNA(Gln) amidotransferase A subunit family amidase
MKYSLTVLAVTCSVLVFIGLSYAQNRNFDLMSAVIDEIQAAVRSGSLTYERLVQLYLKRVETYDKNGPKLNAVIAVNPRALEIARSLDLERKTKGLRSPLHGIPVAVKDNLDTVEIPTTGGNLALAGTTPLKDSTVVRKLRDAGAIILLKTNMDELASSVLGLSSAGGQILNPYNLSRHPGGSSGGTAVAVNVGFATVGIATETGVSVRSPASNNALVGIAPTRGLVSRAGVIPVSYTQDRVGVHAKSVADAAILLSVIRGFDPEDLSTSQSLGKIDSRSYAENLTNDALVGARIGVLRDLFRKGSEFSAGNQIVEQQLGVLRGLKTLVMDGLTTGLDLIGMFPVLRVNDFEFRSAFDAYIQSRGPQSPIKAFSQILASGKYAKHLEASFERRAKVPFPEFDAEYLARLDNAGRLRQAIIELMDRHGVDTLVYPFKAVGAQPIGTAEGDAGDNPVSAVTGLPAIVLPAGFDSEGLPIAIEFLGRPFSEPRLIRMAYAYEQAAHNRVPPRTTPALSGEIFPY